MEVMILSFIGPAVKSDWGLSSGEESLITIVVFAGMLIGAYFWGIISDNFGRRKGLLSIATVTSGAGFLSAFSPNYLSLVILRFMVGIGLGGGPVYTSWFLEFVPVPNRGTWMVIYSTFWTIGTIFEASLAWSVMPRWGWRWLFGISSIPTILALLLYGLTPESPRYLCMRNRITDADDVLKKIALLNKKELPSGVLVSDQTVKLDEKIAPSEDSQLLPLTRSKPTVSKIGFSSFHMLFSSNLIRTSLLIWVIYFGNAFSYYGIILLTSELSKEQHKSSSNTILSDNIQNDSLYIDVFVTSLAELPGLVLSAVIVDRIGRKHSMAILFMSSCLFLLPLVFHQDMSLTTALLFGARMCIIGTFTIAGIYAPEIYPTSVRATGVGVASGVGRIGGMISPLVAVQLVNHTHQTSAILLFEFVILLSGLCVMLLPFETKGKQLIDSTVSLSASCSTKSTLNNCT